MGIGIRRLSLIRSKITSDIKTPAIQILGQHNGIVAARFLPENMSINFTLAPSEDLQRQRAFFKMCEETKMHDKVA